MTPSSADSISDVAAGNVFKGYKRHCCIFYSSVTCLCIDCASIVQGVKRTSWFSAPCLPFCIAVFGREFTKPACNISLPWSSEGKGHCASYCRNWQNLSGKIYVFFSLCVIKYLACHSPTLWLLRQLFYEFLVVSGIDSYLVKTR